MAYKSARTTHTVGRALARELTREELDSVSGASGTYTITCSDETQELCASDDDHDSDCA